MTALLTALLFALLSFVALEDLTPDDISGTVKKGKTRKCHTPENPTVTIGYILHGFNVTTGVEPDTEFHDWQTKVLKKAKEWLQYYKASSAQSTKIEEWTREKRFRSPFKVLEYLKADIKNYTMYNPDIVILVTKVPVTLYDFGFGSYEPLCCDVVPMFLTYNKNWVNDVGDRLGQVILNRLPAVLDRLATPSPVVGDITVNGRAASYAIVLRRSFVTSNVLKDCGVTIQLSKDRLNINNYNEWHKMSAQDRNRYFENCIAQRFGKDYF